MTTNDLNQSKEINFNDLVVEEGLGKYKKIFNKKEIENVILNFNNKKFNKKDLELIFKDIFLNFEKKIILRNILDENYTSPIYEKTPYILYRTLKEGVVYKNTIYRLENGEAIESDARTMGLFYKTEEELSDLMNES